MAEQKSRPFLSWLLGAIGAALGVLIGAGILLPSNEWSPVVEKTGTSGVHVTLPSTDYDRDVLLQAECSGIAGKDGWLKIEIKVNGAEKPCNEPEKTYKNPATPSLLTAKDFCSIVVKKGMPASIELSFPQQFVDSNVATLRIQTRRIGRSLFSR